MFFSEWSNSCRLVFFFIEIRTDIAERQVLIVVIITLSITENYRKKVNSILGRNVQDKCKKLLHVCHGCRGSIRQWSPCRIRVSSLRRKHWCVFWRFQALRSNMGTHRLRLCRSTNFERYNEIFADDDIAVNITRSSVFEYTYDQVI